MTPQSLKGKLLTGVSILVISSGLVISLLVTERYSESLLTAVKAQAESLAHAVALEAAEKVMINDLVATQKMLDHQMRSNPFLAYLFIVRDRGILAHTFPRGVPAQLLTANAPTASDHGTMQKIVSTDGERYFDIAWPILEANAGVLRLGFSEKPLRRQLASLWLQMSLATLGILILAVAGSLIYVKRITRPLDDLAHAVRTIDEGSLETHVRVRGNDEVAALASAFNQMVARMKEYTKRLEEQTLELDRAHNQTRIFCDIVREIGALPTLDEIGPVLIRRLQSLLICREMALLILDQGRQTLFILSENAVTAVRERSRVEAAAKAIQGLTKPTFFNRPILKPPVKPNFLGAERRQAAMPMQSEGELTGALLVACPQHCDCNFDEVDVVSLILRQSAGVINRAVVQEEAIHDLQKRIGASPEFSGIVGKDSKMRLIYKLIEDIAPTDATVLIQGESGTGKELVARAIHQQSHRKHKPFVVINCSAYPDTLLESELFGHERGAFTGAIRRKPGRFEKADGGTVFLDEIGEIPPQAQIKLLRVLQTQRFERIGGVETISVDVRVLAATNKDLIHEVQRGQFREDLFYRLNVIPIFLPPLRERRNDIPLMGSHFLRQFTDEQAKNIDSFSPEAMRLLLDYPWPGNVRELENTVEHAVVLAKGRRIEASDLPPLIRNSSAALVSQTVPLMVETERTLVEAVLAECGWNKKKAARRLGIGRSTLYAKLRKFGIAKPTIQ